MKDDFEKSVLNWYAQFVHARSEIDDHTLPNYLTEINNSDLAKFLSKFGKIIPDSYLKFLRIAGEGRIREDINGKFNEFNDNKFLDTNEISNILLKNSDDWVVYPDFIRDDEIPFFYIGNNAVLVFRKNNGSKVYYPHLDDVYAVNLEEFLIKLMNNINFYGDL